MFLFRVGCIDIPVYEAVFLMVDVDAYEKGWLKRVLRRIG
jgi:hypothetical protein